MCHEEGRLPLVDRKIVSKASEKNMILFPLKRGRGDESAVWKKGYKALLSMQRKGKVSDEITFPRSFFHIERKGVVSELEEEKKSSSRILVEI